MKKYLIALSLICLFSCSPGNKNKEDNKENKKTEVVDNKNAKNSLDYFGTYSGTIPAASGEGIKLKLVLNKDKTYTLVYDYIGEKDGVYTEQGDYTIDKNIITLENKNEPPKYFMIKDNKVVMLNSDKQEVTGDLANMYILNKIPNEPIEPEQITEKGEVKGDSKKKK